MNPRPIMDAGPGINFLSLNKERLLFSVVGALSVPEVVEREILGKARQEERFAPAERVWKKLPQRLMQVLCDDITDELAEVVHRVTGMAISDRARSRKDLGEIMVTAHAVVAAEKGRNVLVLIDDGDGRAMVTAEARRLERLRDTGRGVGSVKLISTLTILEKAAGGKYLPNKTDMRKLYARLRELDDGLVPLNATELMDLPCWK